MGMLFSRRHMLAASAALCTLPRMAAAAQAVTLTAARRTLDVNGRAASVFGLQQADGTAGVQLAPDERFNVSLANTCGAPTIIHWHGQTPPVRQDGVVDTGFEAPIPDGSTQGYDFAPRPGTHWMHSHQGLQEQQLMAAPLIVRTAEDLRLDAQEVIVLLHDFTFRDPAEILAGLTSGRAASGNMNMGGMGMMGGGADLNDVNFDAYLANDRTLRDPQILRVEAGGQVRLRLINGATATAFWIGLGALQGRLLAVDGDPVRPVTVARFPLAQGQRADVLLRLPAGEGVYPVLAQREGGVEQTGIILATAKAQVTKLAETTGGAAPPCGLSLESRLTAAQPLSPRAPDQVQALHLTGGMMGYDWGIDGRQWQNHQPIQVRQSERVALDLINDSMMSHPMHLHGHHFQVVALNGTALAGAMRDTVLVPPMSAVRIAFDANNPGRWLFHCHNLYHMAAGMMTEVVYA